MKHKVLAITLSVALTLSAVPAFAIDTQEYSNKSIERGSDFNNYINNYCYFYGQCNQNRPSVPNKPSTPNKPDTTNPGNSTGSGSSNSSTVSSSNSAYERKVLELVNIERKKNNLSALSLDSSVSNVARTKSKDMAQNNYFSHTSPTYGNAGNILKTFGIKYSAYGENIASGQRSPEAVTNAWMNSSGHRANILSPTFTKLGVGYAVNSKGTPYWTQIFVK